MAGCICGTVWDLKRSKLCKVPICHELLWNKTECSVPKILYLNMDTPPLWWQLNLILEGNLWGNFRCRKLPGVFSNWHQVALRAYYIIITFAATQHYCKYILKMLVLVPGLPHGRHVFYTGSIVSQAFGSKLVVTNRWPCQWVSDVYLLQSRKWNISFLVGLIKYKVMITGQ